MLINTFWQVLFLSFMVVFSTNSVQANGLSVINVPGDYPTIQGAIDASENGDEIIVAPGIYNEAINFLGKAIHLRSSDGPEVTVIDAKNLKMEAILCVSGEGPDTILEGFLVTSDSFGMVIFNSSPMVIGCVFKNNITGVGNYGSKNRSVFINCAFVENTRIGLQNGGGNPVVTSCLFEDNTSLSGGAAMSNEGANAIVTNCVFRNNRIINGTGGAVLNVGNSSFLNCLFENNSVVNGTGGAIANYSQNTTFTNCVFFGNSVNIGEGGAIENGGGSSVFTECIFENNSVGVGRAGAIYNNGSNSTFTDCSFLNNSVAEGGGGAIYSNGGLSHSFLGCSFVGNSVISGSDKSIPTGNGGAIYNNGSSFSLDDCVFNGNFTFKNGGTMYNDGGSVNLINCQFVSSVAESGVGCIFYNGGTTITAFSCSFEIGSGQRGGVMYSEGSPMNITNCVFKENSASDDGGVLYNDGAQPVLTNCTFEDNSAGQNGGAIYQYGPAAEIFSSTFQTNSANNGGAIFVVKEGEPAEIGNSTFCENTPNHVVGMWLDLGGNHFCGDLPNFPKFKQFHLDWGSECLVSTQSPCQVGSFGTFGCTITAFTTAVTLERAKAGISNENVTPLTVQQFLYDKGVQLESGLLRLGDSWFFKDDHSVWAERATSAPLYTLDTVISEIQQGRPVVLLVPLRGNATSGSCASNTLGCILGLTWAHYVMAYAYDDELADGIEARGILISDPGYSGAYVPFVPGYSYNEGNHTESVVTLYNYFQQLSANSPFANYHTGDVVEDNSRIKAWFNDHVFYDSTSGLLPITGAKSFMITKIRSGMVGTPGVPDRVAVESPVEVALTDTTTGIRYVSSASIAEQGDVVVSREYDVLVGDILGEKSWEFDSDFPPYSLVLPAETYGHDFDVEIIGVGTGYYTISQIHTGIDYASPTPISGTISKGQVHQGVFTSTPSGCALFTEQPTGQVVERGDPVEFVTNVGSSSVLEFQWQKDNEPMSDGDGVSGSQTTILSINAAMPSHTGAYRLIAVDDCGVALSITATLKVVVIGDLNADGVVDVSDLLILLSSWGECQKSECSADLNNDGFVDVSDLLILLSNWG
jgi:predicted outer membrane repeat protein